MNRWLLKTEPGEYSFDELKKEKVTVWDGVKAPAALKNMRLMKSGDEVLVYHTGKEKAVVGTGKVLSEPYPDPEKDDDRYVVVKVAAGEPLVRKVSLAKIKKADFFSGWELVKQPRLSVVPVSLEQWKKIIEWGFE